MANSKLFGFLGAVASIIGAAMILINRHQTNLHLQTFKANEAAKGLYNPYYSTSASDYMYYADRIAPYKTKIVIGAVILAAGIIFIIISIAMYNKYKNRPREAISYVDNATSAASHAEIVEDSVEKRFENLEKLKEQGLISEEEYMSKREELMRQI